MPRPYANDPRRERRELDPALLRLLLVIFGVTFAVGLLSGLVYLAVGLLRARFF